MPHLELIFRKIDARLIARKLMANILKQEIRFTHRFLLRLDRPINACDLVDRHLGILQLLEYTTFSSERLIG